MRPCIPEPHLPARLTEAKRLHVAEFLPIGRAGIAAAELVRTWGYDSPILGSTRKSTLADSRALELEQFIHINKSEVSHFDIRLLSGHVCIDQLLKTLLIQLPEGTGKWKLILWHSAYT